ncbi:DAK2 domain-containing protein [Parasphingorhabdus pacifica]
MLQALDEATARRWADACVAALVEDRAAIDRINVYPVADGDTGTNLVHTMRAAVEAARSPRAGTLGDLLGALARGALAGARGNSGMLLSQVLRGIAEQARNVDEMGGEEFRTALLRADELATRAVADPVRGTLLSVLHAAASAADASRSSRLDLVVHKATLAAVDALAETTRQLPPLAEAGVVDAGGRGLVLVLDALHAVVRDGERLAPAAPAAALPATAGGHQPTGERVAGPHQPVPYQYEVMYLLDGTSAGHVASLRAKLGELGDCVSVVADGTGSWAVHVHCDDIGGAIEAGVEAGRAHRIRVVRFADQQHPEAWRPPTARHAVLACVRSGPVAELFRDEGAAVFLADGDDPPEVGEVMASIEETAAAHVVLLPNDPSLAALAEDAAARSAEAEWDAVVIPTASPVQGLAALAVHDPSRRRADDAVAMAEASAATRRGELRVADAEALTWVGRCQPGDVLGLIDGEVVLITDDPMAAACELADRMLTAGGELVTALLAGDSPDSVGEALSEHLRRTHPEVEFTRYPGGELPAVLLLGVE